MTSMLIFGITSSIVSFLALVIIYVVDHVIIAVITDGTIETVVEEETNSNSGMQ